MSGSVNKVILLGNVARAPEIRTMTNGGDIANFTLATSTQWKDKASGERRELTEWNRVSVFNPHLVKVIAQYVKKGTRLYLEGEVRTRKWTGRDGEERMTTQVVLPSYGGVMNIESSPRDGAGAEHRDSQPRGAAQQAASPGYDDEIPF